MKIYYGRISGQQELKNILCKLVEVIVTVLAYSSTKCSFFVISDLINLHL